MPQDKRGQRSAGRPSKGSSRTAAKPVSVKPAKRVAVKAAAKPTAKHQAAKASAKPVVKPVAVKIVAKPAVKRKAEEAVVKPAKKRSQANTAAKATTEHAVETSAIEPAIESISDPTLEQWIASHQDELETEQETPEPVVAAEETPDPAVVAEAEEFHAASVAEPIVDAWGTDALTDAPSEPVVEHAAAPDAAVEPVAAYQAHVLEVSPEDAGGNADSLFKPFIERRSTVKSLLERRLADPSAKERRLSSLAEECAAEAEANQPRMAAAAKARRAQIAAAARDGGVASAKDNAAEDVATPPRGERRVSDRRAGWRGRANKLEGGLRANEQQNLFNETAVWMRKGAAVLIGLNVLVILVVLILWHSRPSQQVDMKEMQKANAAEIAEMKRATAASELAAYASCLGSQTAQGILSQMKAGAHIPMNSGLQPNAATRAQAAQIEFNVEKTTSLTAHVPVLFHLGVENIGKSSALNTKVWGEVRVLDSGKEPDFKYDEVSLTKSAIAATDPETKLVLYTTDAGLVTPLKEEDYQRVQSGAAYVVAYGKVVYQDIYGVRHWAVFCHAITEPISGGKHFGKCMSYNSTGVSEPQSIPVDLPIAPQHNTALMTMPQVACQLPKEEKN